MCEIYGLGNLGLWDLPRHGRELGEKKLARLLAQTLAEEEKADQLLIQLQPAMLEELRQEGAEFEEEA